MNKRLKRSDDNIAAKFISNEKLSTCSNTNILVTKVHILLGERGSITNFCVVWSHVYKGRQ